MGQRGSRIGLVISSIVCLSIATGCGGRMPKALADGSGRLAPCPSSPNCVSSDATDEIHSIAAFVIRGDADTAWKGLASHLAELPRVEVVTNEGGYLQAVFTTRLMRYRDDVEFQLDARSRRDSRALGVANRSRRHGRQSGADRIDSGRAGGARRRRAARGALARDSPRAPGAITPSATAPASRRLPRVCAEPERRRGPDARSRRASANPARHPARPLRSSAIASRHRAR